MLYNIKPGLIIGVIVGHGHHTCSERFSIHSLRYLAAEKGQQCHLPEFKEASDDGGRDQQSFVTNVNAIYFVNDIVLEPNEKLSQGNSRKGK